MFDIAVTNSQENKSLSQVLAMSLAGFIGDIAMKLTITELRKLKPIKGFEGLYSVSMDGKIYSHTMNKFKAISKSHNNKYYSMQVMLYKKNKAYSLKVHRLVATAFIANPENKKTVNHRDGNRENNHVSNLEWATMQENIDHAWETGLFENSREMARINAVVRGYKNRKLSKKTIEEIRAKYSLGNVSQYYLAKKYSVSQGTISNVTGNYIYKGLDKYDF